MTDALPKGLISIRGKCLLEYSLEGLSYYGITTAVMVLGYKAEAIKSKFGSNYAGIKLSYVDNLEYETTGSMYSLLAAREVIDQDILLLESDLIFQPAAIDVLIRSKKKNVILVAPCRGNNDEVYIQTNDQGHLIGLGKTLDRESSLGELVGVSKLTLQFLKRLYQRAEIEFDQGRRGVSYEDAIMLAVSEFDQDSVDCILLKDLLWTDIDTETDLETARAILTKIAALGNEAKGRRSNASTG